MNGPGSWHDSRVAQPIYDKLQDDTPAGYYLVADSAFPAGTPALKGRIHSPLKAGLRLSGSQEELDARMAFNRQLLSYRQTAEWGMRSLQGSFGRLRVPLEVNDVGRRADLLEICVRLHNLRARRVGFNQIRTVYMHEWCADGDQLHLWQSFEHILFSDQRKIDRVSRYHVSLTDCN